MHFGLWSVSPDLLVLAAILGLAVGSFANVCIFRIPAGLSLLRPGSRCPSCGSPIRAWENIPLLSYLLLRGRCRGCRAPISARYPAVELLTALAYAATLECLGPTPRALAGMVFVTILIVLAWIDWDHRVLPGAITLPGLVLGLLTSVVAPPPGPLESAATALGAYLGFFGIAAAYRRVRGVEGLGPGDWKMAAMLGAFLGWKKLILAVFLANLGVALVGTALAAWRRHGLRHALPLGTFLAAGGLVALLVGDALVAWYSAGR